MSDTTVYEAVGGLQFFQRLVDRFYEAVEADAMLRATRILAQFVELCG